MALFELTSIVSLVNASIAPSKGIEASSVYNATKAAIRSFARTWTVDLKHRKIVSTPSVLA